MKSGKEIFKDILASAHTGCVLKIKLRNMPKPIITAVDHVARNKIVLKPTCLYGYRLRKRNITLLEIESVVRYNTYFNHPLFENIRFIKDHIAELRKDFRTCSHEAMLSS